MSKSTSKLGKYIDKLGKTTRDEIEDIFECFDKDEVKKSTISCFSIVLPYGWKCHVRNLSIT